MSAPPYMKLYIADYHVETTELNVIGHGAYLLLLMAMWRAGGKLPRDEAKLCRLAKCTPEQWADVRDDVLDHFKVAGGSIRHSRVTKEIAKYDAVVSGASSAGKASAFKKAKKDNAKSPTNVDKNTQRLDNQPEPKLEPEAVDGGVVGAGDDWPATDHVRILVEAANSPWLDHHKSLGLNTTAGLLLAWKRAGASWTRDVVPIIAAIARAHHEPITSWKFFNNPVLRSLAQARQVLALPEVRNHERTRSDRRQAAFTEKLGDIDAAMVAAFEPEAG